ncbi:MAG: hypothetical protein ABJE95_21840 [Byssovorax sp.]
MTKCYSGPDGTLGKGICKEGMQTCRKDGTGYDACLGDTKPKAESCAAPEDENCDGYDCVQWAELFGDGADQITTGTAIDSTGNIYVTGIFYGAIPLAGKTLISAGATDIFLLKLGSNGKPIWGEQVGDGDYQDGPVVAVDSSDNVFFGGRSKTPISLGGAPVPAGLFIAKLSSDGNHVWSKGLTTEVGCVGSDRNLLGLATTPQNDIVLCGYYCGTIDFGAGAISSKGSSDGFVAKLKGDDGSVNAADETWGRVFGDAASQEVNGVAVDPAGNILIAGTFNGSITFGPMDSISSSGGSDAFVAKLTATGSPSWHVKLGDGADQAMVAISVDAVGGPVVTGTFAGAINFDGTNPVNGFSFIAKYDSTGGYKWSKIITTTGISNGVAIDSAGNTIIAGLFQGSLDLGGAPLVATGSGAEAFVAKLSATGTLVWNKRFGDANSVLATAASVAITSLGEPLVVGNVSGPINLGTGVLTPAGESDVWVAKLSP